MTIKDKFKVGDRVLVTVDGIGPVEGSVVEVRGVALSKRAYDQEGKSLYRDTLYVVEYPSLNLTSRIDTEQNLTQRLLFAGEMKKIQPGEDTGVDSAGVRRTP